MRPVNLLPPRYRPARASGERPGIGYAALGVLAVLLLMVVLYVITNNGINDAKEKTAQAENERAVAQAKIGELQAYGDFQQVKVQRETAVRNIAQLRFDYERLMREVALVMPKNSYLTAFTSAPTGTTSTAATGATGTGPQITISGCSPTHPDVATVIVRLRKLHNVVDVNLSGSAKGAGGGAGAVGAICDTSWNAVLSFNAEGPPTVKEPIPARLGGGQ